MCKSALGHSHYCQTPKWQKKLFPHDRDLEKAILIWMEDNLLMLLFRHILRQVKGNQSQTNHTHVCLNIFLIDILIHRCLYKIND